MLKFEDIILTGQKAKHLYQDHVVEFNINKGMFSAKSVSGKRKPVLYAFTYADIKRKVDARRKHTG